MNLHHDVATAFARLRARRTYTLLAIGMLAVAIASNVAVFTVLSRTLLRTFPFDDTRMVAVLGTYPDAKGERKEIPSGSVDYVHWHTRATTLEGLEISRVFAGSIRDRGETESIKVASVSGGIFRLMRVRPALGHDFTPADDTPQSNVVMLSDGLWRRRFGAQREVVGRTIVIDGRPRTIIGVLPRGFEIPSNRADAFVPAGFNLGNMPNPGSRAYFVFARLKPGATPQLATADLQRITADLALKFPTSHKDYGARVKPLREALFGERRGTLLTLFIAVLLVHVLACVNVANLMLAQISDQRVVTAVRLAIGAPPAQIVRYRVMEALIISVLAAIAGALLGAVAVQAILRNYADPDLLSATGGEGLITAFVIGLTIVTALAVSLVPALREARVPVAPLINEGSQRTSASAGRRRARELFIVAEVALAVPLLIGAAVAVKRLRDLQTFDIGFKPDGVLTAQLIMPERYDRAARSRFAAELVRRLERAPGVESAAVTTSLFRVNGGASTVVRSEKMADFAFVNFRRITPHFFDTVASPLVAGRAFNEGDGADAPPVAIVSESFARQFWPRENPIGKKLVRQSQNSAWLTVVGVARDIRDAGVAEDLGPTLYTPYLQNNHIYLSIVARAKGDDAASLRETVKQVVQSVDGAMAPDEVIPFRQLVDETLGSYKLQLALLGAFAFIALLLAATGIFAVTAYAVSQRMPEIGIRMAFGATPRAVVEELVRAAGGSVLAGVLIGIAITIAAVAAFPPEAAVRANVDVAYAAAVVGALMLSALSASLVPSLRARAAQPADLLRHG